ncbi:MAG: nucleotidyltransferase domain-containing protein [Myxococcota bacterium]
MTWTAQQLFGMPVTDPEKQLPNHLNALINLAESILHPTKIWLFGSRARGDAKDTSDFDLAFEHHAEQKDWIRFLNQVEESPPSLHKYDLVDCNCIDEKLRVSVESEGLVIYDRQK